MCIGSFVDTDVITIDMSNIYLLNMFLRYPVFASKSLFASSLINTGRIQYSGAVGISHVKIVIFCAETCKHNIKCMTFFYSTLSTECVLHSKTFVKYPQHHYIEYVQYLWGLKQTTILMQTLDNSNVRQPE
jgi:hypothetical protein